MGNGASADEATVTPRRSASPRRVQVREFKEVEFQPARDIQPRAQKSSRNQSSAVIPNGHVTTGRHRPRAATPVQNNNRQQPSGSTQNSNRHLPGYVVPVSEDIVFETFFHQTRGEFVCLYQGNERFYLDNWQTHEWQPFPMKWYNEGILVTDTIIREGQEINSQSGNVETEAVTADAINLDDRESFLDHPRRGRLQTYMFEERYNVHCFFDDRSGQWVKMPLGWELLTSTANKLIDQVQDALPDWKDENDILTTLRACNYDPGECITTYLVVQGDHLLKTTSSVDPRSLLEKEDRIVALEKEVEKLKVDLDTEQRSRRTAEMQYEKSMDKVIDLKAEATTAEFQMVAMQQARPRTARPQTARPKTPQVAPVMNEDNGVAMEELEELNEKARNLHRIQIQMKLDVTRRQGELQELIRRVRRGMAGMLKFEEAQKAEMDEVRALYQREALQRKILYNQLQELRGNIRVFCRVRYDSRSECCMEFPSDQDIAVVHPLGSKKRFTFDKVFPVQSTQEEVFSDTLPTVASCVDGYNVCIIAYGQTGSGKTYTMMGTKQDLGVNFRAVKELFKICQERDTVEYTMTVSMVEIYNETLRDLLTKDTRVMELRVGGNRVSIPGLVEKQVDNMVEVQSIMEMGANNRTVGETKMNSTSSRSHLLFMIRVEGTNNVTNAVSTGTLTLCDLAGSERVSKTEADGQRLAEAAAINKSLSALGQVFAALKSNQLHIPYRNSKLTHILQPSLGGDAKACLFVNVSPDPNNMPESLSSLLFASNARQIALGPAKRNITKRSNQPPPR